MRLGVRSCLIPQIPTWSLYVESAHHFCIGGLRDDVFSFGIWNPNAQIDKLGAGLLAAGPTLSSFINSVCLYVHFGLYLTLRTPFS